MAHRQNSATILWAFPVRWQIKDTGLPDTNTPVQACAWACAPTWAEQTIRCGLCVCAEGLQRLLTDEAQTRSPSSRLLLGSLHPNTAVNYWWADAGVYLPWFSRCSACTPAAECDHTVVDERKTGLSSGKWRTWMRKCSTGTCHGVHVVWRDR